MSSRKNVLCAFVKAFISKMSLCPLQNALAVFFCQSKQLNLVFSVKICASICMWNFCVFISFCTNLYYGGVFLMVKITAFLWSQQMSCNKGENQEMQRENFFQVSTFLYRSQMPYRESDALCHRSRVVNFMTSVSWK